MRLELMQVIQVGYWLALSAWFGGSLFIAIAAQGIFRTVKENNPILPHVLAVNLEDQHSTLLAGAIVGNLIMLFGKIEIVCAALLLVTIGAQWCVIDLQNHWNLYAAVLRSALFVAATVIAGYDSRVVWPKIWKSRQMFIDNADEPDKANPALEEFNRHQRESMTLLSILLFLLLGILVCSGTMGLSIASPSTN